MPFLHFTDWEIICPSCAATGFDVKIFLTGADGFIGSHLAEALVCAGHDVRALVQYNSFNSKGWLDETSRDIMEELDIIAGDIRDRSQMRECVKDCEAVLHLAAMRYLIPMPLLSLTLIQI